eukprot:Nk52_evm6s1524 gene=Nk52_evmTU6s1524
MKLSLRKSFLLCALCLLFLRITPRSTAASGVLNYGGPERILSTTTTSSSCALPGDIEALGWSGKVNSKHIVIEVGGWLSSHITGQLVALILRDGMGYTNVTVVERGESVLVAGGDNPMSRCGNGQYHLNVERWTSGYDELIDSLVTRQKLCEVLGNTGYVGRSGMYVNNVLVDQTKGKGFVEFYKSFVNDKSYWDGMGPMESEPVGNCTRPFCNDLDPVTGKNRYLSTECRRDKTQCKTVHLIKDTWATGVLEGWAELYSLPFAFEYYGTVEAQKESLTKAHNSGVSTVAYQWAPTLGSVSFNLTRVILAESNSDCFKQDRIGVAKATCDFPSEILFKAVWSGLKDYDFPTYRLIQKLSIGEQLISALLMLFETNAYTNNATGAFQADVLCTWMKSNANLWKQWVPFPTSVVDFETTFVSLYIPLLTSTVSSVPGAIPPANEDQGVVIEVKVVRKESDLGMVTASYKDVTNDPDIGGVLLKQHSLQPAILGKHYIMGKSSSNSSRKEQSSISWADRDMGTRGLPITFLEPEAGYGIVVGIVDVIADSAVVGPHNLVTIEVRIPSCDDVVPGKKGGMFLFDDFLKSEEVDSAGTTFTTAFLLLFALEFVLATVFVVWRDVNYHDMSRTRKIAPSQNEEVPSKTSRRKTSRKSSVSNVGFIWPFEIPSLLTRKKELITQIDPVMNNLFPVLAVIMDFPQFLSLVTSTEIEWLRDSQAIDFISLSSLSLDWYFWLIVFVSIPWTFYIVALLIGLDERLESTLVGRIVLFPSDYLVPLGASVLFIPAVTNLLRVFTCVLTPENIGYPPLVLNEQCSITCWDGIHWAYATIGGSVLIFYWPLALYASPLWQSVKGEEVQVVYRSRFFHIDVMIKTVLVVMRVFFRQFVFTFYSIVIFCFLIYLFVFVTHRPCKVPWIVNLRIFLYASLVVISIVIVSTMNDDSIYPPTVMAIVFVLCFTVYVYWDQKEYPKKIIHKSDQTRAKIRQFLATYGETESITSSCGSLSGSEKSSEHKDDSECVCGIQVYEDWEVKNEVNFTDIGAADWLSLERFTFRLCKERGVSVDEYEFIAYLTVVKSELILDVWKKYHVKDSRNALDWILGIAQASSEFYLMDRSKGLIEGMQQERKSFMKQRESTAVRMRKRTHSFREHVKTENFIQEKGLKEDTIAQESSCIEVEELEYS